MTAGCRREEKDKRVEDVQDKLCLVSCSAHCSQSSAGGSEAARSTPSHPRTQVHTLSLADDRVFLCCNYASALRPSTGLKVQRLQACYVPCVSRDTWHCKSLCCSLTCVGECRTHRFCTEARGWFILIVIATRPSQVSAPAAAVIVAVAKLNVSRASTLDSSAQCDSKNRDATPPIIPPSTAYLPTRSTAPPDIALACSKLTPSTPPFLTTPSFLTPLALQVAQRLLQARPHRTVHRVGASSLAFANLCERVRACANACKRRPTTYSRPH